MATYTYSQLEGAWIAAGGPASVAPTMAAIGEAESGGSDVIQQGQPYSTTGWGVWQITPGNSEPSVASDNGLLNLQANAKAAVLKYQQQGITAWSTYTSGAYQKFMQNGVTPAADIGSNSPFGSLGTSGGSLGSSLLNGLLSGLGLGSTSDMLERAGLIILGGLLLIVGLYQMANPELQATVKTVAKVA